MLNRKSDKTEQPGPEEQLQKRVDEMMDVKRPESGVSEVAASVNESLSQNLSGGSAVKPLKPEIPVTAPELPGELKPEIEDKKAVDSPELAKTEETISEDVPIGENFDDNETEKAVDDIVAKEGDTVLAVEDAQAARKNKILNPDKNWKDKLKSFFKNKWTWVVAAALLVILLGLPVTRYKILGLVLKKTVTITIIDSKTATPVSSASVQLGGDSVKTDANGKAKIKAGIGKRELAVSKTYYSDLKTSYFVGFKAAKPAPIKLIATGRLVPVSVVNKVTGKPVAGVQVQILGTSAKTNSKGIATIALPTKKASNPAKLKLNGYNSSNVTVQVTDKVVKANTFELVPAGQIYFLSNRSGNLDVVKSNLDGSGRKTVLEGTGKEDRNTTSLLASRDWRYVVLKSKREGAQAALYLIDTSTDKVTQFDNSDADFSLVGWYDHSFIYSLTRNNVPYWQNGRQAVKSYDAERLQLNQLDQSLGEGSTTSYAYQNLLNFYIVKGALVYNTQWNSYANFDMNGKNNTIRAVQPTGQNKKDYQSFATSDSGYIQASLYEPNGVYFAVYETVANKSSFYVYEDQAVKTASIDQSAFDKVYPTFLLSPSGNQTFWSELRDGKNALFTGDAAAANKKQIASLSDYAPYGWHDDNYLLVSKSSSELYVTTPASLAAKRPPLKVTDYYKPAQSYEGYGYGYGGL